MHSLTIEQELIKDFEQRESAIRANDTFSMRRFGQFDPDQPVSIPFVSTEFIIEQPQTEVPKVVTASLPSSSDASPQQHNNSSGVPPLPSGRYKKHFSDPTQKNVQLGAAKSLVRDNSVAMTSFSRSKSCGEGRSSEPSEDLNVLSTKGSTQRMGSGAPLIDKSNEEYSSGLEPPKPSNAGDFKCGALCIYLPGFSKKKPVQAMQEHQTTSSNPNVYDQPENSDRKSAPTTRPSGMSRVPSLERFDCLSVSSNNFIDHWNEVTGSSYFDLPLELIQSCDNETDAPVTTAFVFEKEKKKGRRSSRNSSKRRSSKASHESSRRTNNDLRFSGSSKISNGSLYPSSPPSACVSPKIRKARDELNAFIEAQTA